MTAVDSRTGNYETGVDGSAELLSSNGKVEDERMDTTYVVLWEGFGACIFMSGIKVTVMLYN